MTSFREDGLTAKVLWQHEGLDCEAFGNITSIAIAPASPVPPPEFPLTPGLRLWVVAEFDVLGKQISDRVAFEAPVRPDHWLLAKGIAALRRHDPDHQLRLQGLGPLMVSPPSDDAE